MQPKRSKPKKRIADQTITLAPLGFEDALRAAMATGTMPMAKRKLPKSKKPLRHKG